MMGKNGGVYMKTVINIHDRIHRTGHAQIQNADPRNQGTYK